jgi:hypothetical protein
VPRPYGSEDVLVGAGLKPAPTSAERKRHAGMLHPRERTPPGLRKPQSGLQVCDRSPAIAADLGTLRIMRQWAATGFA